MGSGHSQRTDTQHKAIVFPKAEIKERSLKHKQFSRNVSMNTRFWPTRDTGHGGCPDPGGPGRERAIFFSFFWHTALVLPLQPPIDRHHLLLINVHTVNLSVFFSFILVLLWQKQIKKSKRA